MKLSRRVLSLFISVLLVTSILLPIIIRPAMADAAWYDPNWLHRKKITIDYTKVQGGQVGFPVLVNLASDSDLASKAQTTGNDILFTSSDGTTKIPHEIEKYIGTTGELWAWVKADLSSSANTVLYMYYDNIGAGNQQNKPGTWDSSFKMVQHLSETSGTHADSTSNSNTGTANGGMSQGVAGKIAGADNFDGTDDYISVPDSASLNFGTGSDRKSVV